MAKEEDRLSSVHTIDSLKHAFSSKPRIFAGTEPYLAHLLCFLALWSSFFFFISRIAHFLPPVFSFQLSGAHS